MPPPCSRHRRRNATFVMPAIGARTTGGSTTCSPSRSGGFTRRAWHAGWERRSSRLCRADGPMTCVVLVEQHPVTLVGALVDGDAAVDRMLADRPLLGLLVVPPFQREPEAADRPAVRHHEDLLPGPVAEQCVEEGVHPPDHVGEALPAGRPGHEPAERL